MLEATLEYSLDKLKQSLLQDSSAIRTRQELTQELPGRMISLLCTPFGLGWGDRNKPYQSSLFRSDDSVHQNQKVIAMNIPANAVLAITAFLTHASTKEPLGTSTRGPHGAGEGPAEGPGERAVGASDEGNGDGPDIGDRVGAGECWGRGWWCKCG
uniref:Uncharacterized protein n=1 Tax=Tanacetum cinerariifolium TaxID=118510 RepID=A0A699GM12_TANCI|nr:hypothetical protein [Tanacetum cinerariifolium]